MRYRNVAVTGGSGRVGRYVVEELRAHTGVTVLDRNAPDNPEIPYHSTDVMDLDALRAGLDGHDAVVHLAAIDFDFQAAPEEFMRVNVMGSWHVLQAAQELGIRRVVLCSSVAACGLSEARPDFGPRYLPVDEDHPDIPRHSYGVSKKVIETMAHSFTVDGGMEVCCLRPMMVAIPQNVPETVERGRERSARWLFYYIAPEDLARAFRCALDTEGLRYGVYFITARDSCTEEPTLDLVRRIYGEVPELRKPRVYQDNPRASVFDGSRARDALGFEPRLGWQELVREHGQGR